LEAGVSIIGQTETRAGFVELGSFRRGAGQDVYQGVSATIVDLVLPIL
jgi:hypothetical protein